MNFVASSQHNLFHVIMDLNRVGSLAGNGCAGSVVMFFDGSKTLGSRMW